MGDDQDRDQDELATQPVTTDPTPAQGEQLPDQPGGLLGLILWPLRAVISLALQVFSAFVAGVLGAFLPRKSDPDGSDPDGSDPDGSDPDGSPPSDGAAPPGQG